MNSVPKTNLHADDFGKLELPCIIEQDYDRSRNEINNHVFEIDEPDDGGRKETMVIFRVYPKRQNPMAIKRRGIENDKHLL